jgi:hypothetical protein
MAAFTQYWPMVVFGWPGAIVGGALLVAGVVLRRTGFSITGVLVSAGFCAYVTMNPAPLRWLGLPAIVGNLLSAVAVQKKAHMLAAVSMTPFFALAIWLAYAVLNE